MVASQINALKPTIIKEASVKAEQMVNRELPGALAKMDAATDRLVADAQKISRDKNRRLENVYADAEREVKDSAQRLTANLQSSGGVSVMPQAQGVGTALFTSGVSSTFLIGTPRDTNFLVSVGTKPQDSILNPTQLKLPEGYQWIPSTSAVTTYTQTCYGDISLPTITKVGVISPRTEDCKSKPLFESISASDRFIPTTNQ
jgi:hypothetical protein